MGWPTVAEVVNDAAQELGIASSADIGDPYSSQDPNVLQLLALLKKVGRSLLDVHDWTHLRKERIIWTGTVPGYIDEVLWGAFPLPIDFRDMVDQTAWNRSTRLPTGPTTPQQWSMLKSRLTGVVYNVLFRPMQGLFFTYPDSSPITEAVLSYEYRSSFWVNGGASAIIDYEVASSYTLGRLVRVAKWQSPSKLPIPPDTFYIYQCIRPGTPQDAETGMANTALIQYGNLGGTTTQTDSVVYVDGQCQWNFVGVEYPDVEGTFRNYGTADAPSAGTDTVLWDANLVTSALKLAWLKAKGFEWGAAQEEYAKALEAAVGNDTAAPRLQLSGPGVIDPLLGGHNIPITGYGG